MVVDLVLDGVDNASCRTWTLVVLNSRLARLLAGPDNLECREALDAELTAERLVGVIVAIYRGDLGKTVEGDRGLFVGRFQVLAVTAPRSVELDDLMAGV